MSFSASCSLVVLALLLSGCGWQMAEQPRWDPYEPTSVTSHGSSAMKPPTGTVSRQSDETDAPPEVTEELIERGRQRYTLACALCHGETGKGDGRIVERGFPRPPSFLSARLREANDLHFWSAITNGAGRMFPYAERVSPRDRWAIVAWIRVLQLAQPQAEADKDSTGKQR